MITNFADFDINRIVSRETILPRGGRGTPIIDCVCAFDIETTRLANNESIMYIWQLDIEGYDTIIGREWKDFLALIEYISASIGPNKKLIIYVHNLSFEFQFLTGIYNFDPESVFCLQSRQILKATMYNNIELRCSYKQTNMSLDKFLKIMDVENKKLTYDYEKKRYSWTPLNETELSYCINDVRGLTQAIRKRMTASGDTLATIPLTSTGYVRRDAKKALYWYTKNSRDIYPDYDIYLILREAFRGGNTHANRYIANNILDNVLSWDRSSSYPDVLLNCKFPVGKFYAVHTRDLQKIKSKVAKDRALLLRVALKNVALKDKFWPVPYISYSKCRNCENVELDNGRILSADRLETTITDVDLEILEYQYNYELEILEAHCAKYGYLPKAFRDLIIKYYREKTELKTGDQYQYFLRKALLNSLYGMCAQDPGKENVIFKDNEFIRDPEWNQYLKIAEYDEKGFLPYQWGVWCTAWARLRLEEGIRLVYEQGGKFVYCDTDSVKYVGDVDWTEYNKQRREDSEKSGAYADDATGKRHYMGEYEQEETYVKFKTMGAKKYAYVYGDGKTHITIAGVGKAKGAEELDKAGGLEAMKEGFIFTEAGGLEAKYNTHDPYEIEIDGHKVKITNNICLIPSTYEIGLTNDYRILIDGLATIK